jgi:hypothetical protein
MASGFKKSNKNQPDSAVTAAGARRASILFQIPSLPSLESAEKEQSSSLFTPSSLAIADIWRSRWLF